MRLEPDALGPRSRAVGEVGDLEGQVVGPGSVASRRNRSRKSFDLGVVGHEQLDPGAVPEPELCRVRTRRRAARAPLGTEVDGVAVPDVLPAGDGVGDVVEHDAADRCDPSRVTADQTARDGAVLLSKRARSGRPPVVTVTCRAGTGTVGAMDFRTESVVGLARQVREGERRRGELVDHALERIAAHNPTINAFVAVDDGAGPRPRPRPIDAQVAAGVRSGPSGRDPHRRQGPRGRGRLRDHPRLAGLRRRLRRPRRTRRWWPGWWPPGAWWSGKTNTPELGWKADTDNAVFGPTLNPWNLDHTAGRLVRWERGGHRRRHGAAGHRLRRRRLDPHPVVVLRPVRHEAVARPGAERWRRRRPTGSTSRPRGRWLAASPTWWRRSTWWSDPIRPICARCRVPRRRGWPCSTTRRPPRRVAWSPTLGYAEIDAEVLAICERAVEVHGVARVPRWSRSDTVFDEDPVDDWLDADRRLQPADPRR